MRRTAWRNRIAAGFPQVAATEITGHRADSAFVKAFALQDRERQ